jgi:2-polyprenyl-6-methoxyphenol hydroxylase-like FAD-dependent oxidoreductase
MTEHAVVIAGGGPTGMMLSAELALAGVDVAIVERRPTRELAGSRAGGLHARTLEIFDMRGIVDRFLAEGQIAQVTAFGGTPLDISDFPTRHNYGLGLWQNHIERILDEWIRELGVKIHRGHDVTGFLQNDDAVDITVSDGKSVRAQYLVGCDGGRSTIRKQAGIDFPGWDATQSNLIAEVELATLPELGMRRDAHGVHGFGRVHYEIRDGKAVFADSGPIRVMVPEAHVGSTSEPTLQDLRDALIRLYDTDYGVHSPTWISRFTDAARQASAYRKGRVLLAGDAAHVHPPHGGQGLNLGIQDAVNLGWKLAQVVSGVASATLLDTYHTERHPVAARVLRNTLAQVALSRTDDRTDALREITAELVRMEQPRKRLAAEMSGLGVHYDLGTGHPLLGRRMPDLDLLTGTGTQRVSATLREARPVLISLQDPQLDVGLWRDRVLSIGARHEEPWKLPVFGVVSPPSAVLVRPDGYVAWVGEGSAQGLLDALEMWCGVTARG